MNEIMSNVNHLTGGRAHSALDIVLLPTGTRGEGKRWRAFVAPRSNPTLGLARHKGEEQEGRIESLMSLRDEVVRCFLDHLRRRLQEVSDRALGP